MLSEQQAAQISS